MNVNAVLALDYIESTNTTVFLTGKAVIPKDGKWINHISNKMEMAPHLIEAVFKAL